MSEPNNNVESILTAILKNDSKYVVEPQSRVEELLLAIYKNGGGGGGGSDITRYEVEQMLLGKVDTIPNYSLMNDEEILRLSSVKNYDDKKIWDEVGKKVSKENGQSLITNNDYDSFKTLRDTTVPAIVNNITSLVPNTRSIAGKKLEQDISVSDLLQALSLDKVNNTSDADKPISTATQTALNAKVDTDRKIADITIENDITAIDLSEKIIPTFETREEFEGYEAEHGAFPVGTKVVITDDPTPFFLMKTEEGLVNIGGGSSGSAPKNTYDATSEEAISGKGVADAIKGLAVTDTEETGKYVSAVSETDGKIIVIKAALPTSLPASDVTDEYNENGTVPVSGKAVKKAIDNIPSPMIFKAVANSASDLETPVASGPNKNVGWTYKVGTAFKYGDIDCKTGDMLICDGTKYEYVPSANEDNIIETIKVNGTPLTVGSDKSVNVTVDGLGLAGAVKVNQTATVGQILAVKAVDSNGKPTEWETITNTASGTSVKVGSSGSTYSPTDGVVTIPAYPTSLPANGGTASNVSGTVAISHGGTGATSAANARTNLGLGAAAVKGVETTITATDNSVPTSNTVKKELDKKADKTELSYITGLTRKNLLSLEKVSASATGTLKFSVDKFAGTVSVVGTAGTTSSILEIKNAVVNEPVIISTGNSEASESGCYMDVYDSDWKNRTVVTNAEVSRNNVGIIRVVITAKSTVDITLKPMVRKASISDSAFEPYHLSLQEQIDALRAAIPSATSE